MIHNHEVPSSILGPATKKATYLVAFLFMYLSSMFALNRLLFPIQILLEGEMLTYQFKIGMRDR